MKLGEFYAKHRMLINILLFALIIRMAFMDIPTIYSFDEGFYVDAAKDIISGRGDTNWHHPSLGKLVISLSIGLFGDSWLGWRLPSLIFGLMSIGFAYFLVLELSKNKKLALFSSFFIAADFLHVILSKTAMLDMMLLGFLFGGAYYAIRKKPNLVLSGLFFGAAISTKWAGIFGLTALVIYLLVKKQFSKKHLAYLIFIPILVYYIAYLVGGGGIGNFVASQSSMFTYHIELGGPLISQISSPVDWLIGQKAIWFAISTKPIEQVGEWYMFLYGFVGEQGALSIILFGNPVFWVLLVPSLFFIAHEYWKKRKDLDLFLLLWFALFYLPWFMFPRENTYIYYMLPVVPVLAIAVSKLLMKWRDNKIIYAYAGILILSLALFYPAISGMPIHEQYFEMIRFFVGTSP